MEDEGRVDAGEDDSGGSGTARADCLGKGVEGQETTHDWRVAGLAAICCLEAGGFRCIFPDAGLDLDAEEEGSPTRGSRAGVSPTGKSLHTAILTVSLNQIHLYYRLMIAFMATTIATTVVTAVLPPNRRKLSIVYHYIPNPTPKKFK